MALDATAIRGRAVSEVSAKQPDAHGRHRTPKAARGATITTAGVRQRCPPHSASHVTQTKCRLASPATRAAVSSVLTSRPGFPGVSATLTSPRAATRVAIRCPIRHASTATQKAAPTRSRVSNAGVSGALRHHRERHGASHHRKMATK